MLIVELRMLELKGGQVTLCASWEKWQKHYVLLYTLHTHAVSLNVSYTCFEHLFTMKLTQMVEIRAQFLRFRDLTPFSSRLLNCIQSNLYKTGIIEYVCPQNYTPPHTHQQTKTKAVRDSLQKTLFTFMFLQGTPRKLYCTREPVYCKIFLGIVQMKNSFEYYIMSKYAQIIFEQFWFPYTIIYPKAPSF